MDAAERLKFLDGKTFKAADVRGAIGMNPTTFNNVVNKSGIMLCSDPPGQGKTRYFPLIDVYQLVIFEHIVERTGSVSLAVANTRELLLCRKTVDGTFGMYIEPEKEDPVEIDKRRQEAAHSVFSAPLPYHFRHDTDKIYMSHHNRSGCFHWRVNENVGRFLSATVLNITSILEIIDRQLFSRLDPSCAFLYQRSEGDEAD